VFTDHMVTVAWTAGRGWHDATVGPYGPLAIDPAAAALHHGASVFEGLKVYRLLDGTLAAFRPDRNAARLRRSAARLAMPEPPEELFLAALDELLAVDHAWVPAAGGEDALYVRPLLFSPAVGLRPEPGDEALFVLIASPAGAYFRGGLAPVRAWMGTDQVRAWPGGTGAAKAGVNYAASLAAQAEARAHGCDQVVWLDATHRRWVEEMGVMNLFFVVDDADHPGSVEVVTPELNDSFLPGVTRDSVLTLAGDLGARPVERPFAAREWLDRARDGTLREVFASGTAAVITPVGAVVDHDGDTPVADGRPGPVTTALRDRLTGIQQGRHDDRHGWLRVLRPG
jgi:branched-chain amino acid aminotransferase